jgi:phytoene synthase
LRARSACDYHAVSDLELDAAGIRDPALRAAYTACRQIHQFYGRAYFLATRLLPAGKRPFVHALYAFARHTDEIVDGMVPSPTGDADRLARWTRAFGEGYADTEIAIATYDTIQRWDIGREHFVAFLASMRMDLTIREYETYDDLAIYVHGSAAAIGLQLLPILQPEPGAESSASVHARQLGTAFQLTNFIRDVGEDLRRDRIYLPQEDLHRFGVDREHLAAGVVDEPVRKLLAFEIERARELYRQAEPGIDLLHKTSRDCIRTASRLYAEILDAVEAADYQVLDRRVKVGWRRRTAIAAPGYLRAARSRAILGPRAGLPKPRSTWSL